MVKVQIEIRMDEYNWQMPDDSEEHTIINRIHFIKLTELNIYLKALLIRNL